MDPLGARLQSALGDEFAVERELGGGGMSRLFVATDRTLGRAVVVKVLPPELTSELSAARFQREILTVTTQDAKAMTRRLAREEAIFAGSSSGANVVAALRVAERLGANATVATIIVDSGLRYLSTDVFRA
jgi:cysteine synthase